MLISINPANGKKIAEYKPFSDKEINHALYMSEIAFELWSQSDIEHRKKLMHNLAKVLSKNKNKYAKLITEEMGKPFAQSVAEVEKCAKTAELYANNIKELIQSEIIKTENKESYVEFEPLGAILAVMPWNYPFWQVFRFAIPNLLLGNVCLLKHASNVQGSAILIEKIFEEAGFPKGVFINLRIGSEYVEKIIRDERVKAVTLTGSEIAGSKVASVAGSQIKKTVLELGGSDPFIVLSDVDLHPVCKSAVNARLRNSGQACTSAKRFIVMKDIAEEFIQNYVNYFKSLKVGNPMDDVDVGPLISKQALEEIQIQVSKSIEMGAKLEIGGKILNQDGFYFEPTILSDVKKGMPAYDEEIFGPVSSVIIAESEDDLIRIANDTKFGLASSIWTKDIEKAKLIAKKIQAGSVFINTVPTSDPRMPFGGIKKSGYGRELSKYGLREFVNIKTIVIN